MKLKYKSRYDLLCEQFNIDSPNLVTSELRNSLDRIFSYVYTNTKIMYIEFIDEKVCCNYIKYQQSKHFNEISYLETLKDIKHFNYFIHNIKSIKNAPVIKLSIKNTSFWMKLIEDKQK